MVSTYEVRVGIGIPFVFRSSQTRKLNRMEIV
uniref:Uncharacterized protein n=1 Tax=Anguilla anguilla TaxID=7936 RepID=A0A0E9SPD1_ANGAN